MTSGIHRVLVVSSFSAVPSYPVGGETPEVALEVNGTVYGVTQADARDLADQIEEALEHLEEQRTG